LPFLSHSYCHTWCELLQKQVVRIQWVEYVGTALKL
jgi:hypothetical protein